MSNTHKMHSSNWKNNDSINHIKNLAMLGCLLFFALAVFMPGAGEANAAEGGKEAENLYVKIAPLSINLHGLTRSIQVTMTLKVANPSQANTVKLNMPIIRNELIYLLSDKNPDQYQSPVEKQALLEEVRHAINKSLSLTIKNGVTEVFFESFIVV